MSGSPRPEDSAPAHTSTAPSRLVLLAAVIILGIIGLVLSSELPAVIRRTVGGLALVISGVALALACRYRYLRSTGRRRRSWLLLCCASLMAAAGNLWVTVSDFVGAPHWRLGGDLVLSTGLAVAVVGLAIYPAGGPRRLTDLARVVLDGIVLASSILLVLSQTLIPKLVEPPSMSALAVLMAPVIDIVLVTVAWLLLLRSTRRDRPTLALAALGFGLFAVSDITATVQRATSGFTFGTLVDLGWIAGYTMLAIAVRWSQPMDQDQRPPPERAHTGSPVTGTLVMFAIFFVAGALTLRELPDGTLSPTVVVLLGGILAAITARQVLLLVDNDRLRASLEQRVIERSTELAEVTERTDLMIDSVDDGVYVVDGDGRVSFVNPAGCRVLGVGRSALLGRSAHDAFHSHPKADCYLRTIQRDGQAISGLEDTHRSAHGDLIPVEVSASPMVEGGGVRGVVVVFRDITRRREVDRMKSEFVSLVSHELKTPLTAIRGSLGLLAGGALGELSPPATRMVEIAVESSERLTRLINEILDLERIESGALPMEIAPHPAAELLTAAHDQVQVLAREAGIEVTVGRREGSVLADSDRVVQTLINLVGNAIKFSPRGSSVRMRAVAADEADEMVTFAVEDSGRGIPENRLESIFERFVQVDSSDARDKGGSGLGLAICRRIVERQGGRIWAENNPGGGATFSFTLPRAALEESEVQPALLKQS